MQSHHHVAQQQRVSRRLRRAWSQRKPGQAKALCDELHLKEAPRFDCDLDASRGLELLDTSGVTSAPVVDDNGVLVGVVFLSTLARLRERAGLEVEDAMRTDVVTASQRASVAEVARLMARHDLERVPVVSEDGHLIGVVSAMDLVRWLARQLPEAG